MKKITYSKSIYPNFATGLNIFFGFVSIVYASQDNFKLAALAIFIAAFFDLIDGLIARLLKTSSRLGVELDSLADVVSFGAAPSFLIYQSELISYGWIGVLISSSILIFGGFRLARFNVQLEDITKKIDFKGLPVPAAGIAIASIVLFYHNGLNIIEPLNTFIIPIIFLLSLLMISNIKYNTLPKVKILKIRR
jgi:CDP-diacylglycerol--serine O-phosphatidyltransferase